MEYRGVTFRLLQTIDRGWQWEFEIDGVSRTGVCQDRSVASSVVRRAIDEIIKNKRVALRAARLVAVQAATIAIARKFAERSGKSIAVYDVNQKGQNSKL